MKKLLCIVLGAMALASCTEKGENQYIKLSDAYCMFNCTGNEPLQLTVVSKPGQWEAEPDVPWLTLSQKTSNTVQVTAAANPDQEERKGRIVFKAGDAEFTVNVMQMGADVGFARYRQLYAFQLGAMMSPSGKYVGGFYATLDDDGLLQYHPVIIDVATDEWHTLGPYPVSIAALYTTSTISDQGMVIFDTEQGGQMAFQLDGSYERIVTPEGFSSYPTVQSTSADGKYWVGYAMKGKGDDGLYYPVKWTDGVGTALPLPEKSYRDVPFITGAMARGISANGEIIYGTTWDNLDFGMIYWDKEGKVHYVGEDVRKVRTVKRKNDSGEYYDYNIVDGMMSMSANTQVSPNGRWIAGTYRTEELAQNEMDIVETYTAAFYNTETNKTYIMDSYGDSTCRGVTDDGKGFVAHGHEMITTGVVVDIETGTELGTAQEYIMDKYGIVVPNGYIEYIAAGEEVVLGCYMVDGAMQPEDCYFYVAPALK